MVATALTLAFALRAAWDDLRQKKILNVTTYTGMLAALAFNALGSVWEHRESADTSVAAERWSHGMGWIGLPDSLLGLFACGSLMLLAYVFFQIGGGDVKLIAMLGAFLGLERGVEVMLWTLVLGAAAAVCTLIWTLGAWSLARHACSQIWQAWKLGGSSTLSPELKAALQPDLHLAPCAVAALCIVKFSSV